MRNVSLLSGVLQILMNICPDVLNSPPVCADNRRPLGDQRLTELPAGLHLHSDTLMLHEIHTYTRTQAAESH